MTLTRPVAMVNSDAITLIVTIVDAVLWLSLVNSASLERNSSNFRITPSTSDEMEAKVENSFSACSDFASLDTSCARSCYINSISSVTFLFKSCAAAVCG